MYLLCMNKNRLQARLGCWFFFLQMCRPTFVQCYGLLYFIVAQRKERMWENSTMAG